MGWKKRMESKKKMVTGAGLKTPPPHSKTTVAQNQRDFDYTLSMLKWSVNLVKYMEI